MEAGMIRLLIIAVYLMLLLGLGFFASRLFTGSKNDYLLASHSIGPFLLLMSIFGTTMTAFALVGSTGEAFKEGIGVYGMLASSSGIIHSLCFFVIGVKVYGFGRKYGYTTQIQFFRDRLESDFVGVLLFPILVALIIPYLLIGVMASGTVRKFDKAEEVILTLSKVSETFTGIRLGDYKSVVAYFLIASSSKDSDRIISLLEEANELYYQNLTNSKSDEKISKNLDYLSKVYAGIGEIEKAKVLCDVALDSIGAKKFIDTPKEIINKVFALKFIKNLLQYSISENDNAGTQKFSNYVKEISRVLILDNTSAGTKLYWAQENLELFSTAIDALVNQGNLDLAYTLAEENKSNILINDLNKDLANGFAGVKEEIIQKERNLRSNIRFFRDKINADPQSKNSKLIEQKLQAEQELNLLIEKIQQDSPEFHNLKYNSSDISISDVQNMLDENTALVEYFISDKQSYVFYITSNKKEVIPLDEYASMKPKIDAFYSLITDKNKTSQEIESYSKELYTLLLPEAEKSLGNNIKNLIIVPDDILSNIPFELLKKETENYLGFDYNISYQYSSKLMKLINERSQNHKRYDFIGFAFDNGMNTSSSIRSCYDSQKSNLKCSRKEIETISEIINKKKINTSASKMHTIFEQASETSILHLATHACADPSNPDFSTLYFNNESITTSEIKLKEIGADLIVLSACDSGFGKVNKGEGAMSLSKSFFHAGCNSTLVSYWPVDDCTTADLMSYFYKNLNDGQEKHVALANAKKSYVENTHPLTAKPYYWAGFVIIGDESAIWPNAGFPTYYLLFGILLLAVLFVLFKSKKG